MAYHEIKEDQLALRHVHLLSIAKRRDWQAPPLLLVTLRVHASDTSCGRAKPSGLRACTLETRQPVHSAHREWSRDRAQAESLTQEQASVRQNLEEELLRNASTPLLTQLLGLAGVGYVSQVQEEAQGDLALALRPGCQVPAVLLAAGLEVLLTPTKVSSLTHMV